MQDDEVEGDPLFGQLRLVLGALAAIILPVWLIATVTLATVSEEIRYLDGGDDDNMMMMVDLETGETVRAERSQQRRLAIAGLQVGLWVVGAFVLLTPLAVVGALVSARRKTAVDTEPVLSDDLVEGAELQVRVRRGAEWPEGAGASTAGAFSSRQAESTYDDPVDTSAKAPSRPAEPTVDTETLGVADAEPTFNGEALDIPTPLRPMPPPRASRAEPTFDDSPLADAGEAETTFHDEDEDDVDRLFE